MDATDAGGETPLRWAAQWGQTGVLALLLAGGADVDPAMNGGYTALHCAARHGHAAAVRELLRANADKNARTTYADKKQRRTVLTP